MAWKAFNTANGMILGERDSESATDYQTDALGSVVGTFGANGTLQNTYRYSGYGQQVSKSGNAPDSKFLWVGSWGYRSVTPLGFYVRHRHLAERAYWTTTDMAFPTQPSYVYALANPLNLIDPLGHSACPASCCTPENRQARINSVGGGNYDLCPDIGGLRKGCAAYLENLKILKGKDLEEICGKMHDAIEGRFKLCASAGSGGTVTLALVWCCCKASPSGGTQLEHCGQLCNSSATSSFNPCEMLCLVAHEQYHAKECAKRGQACNPMADDGMGWSEFNEPCAYKVQGKCLYEQFKDVCKGTGVKSGKTWGSLGHFGNWSECQVAAVNCI